MNDPRAPSAARAPALRRVVRVAALAALLALVLFAAVYAAARIYLPALVGDEERLEARLAAQLGHPVAIGRVSVDWAGIYPRIRAQDVAVTGAAGEPAIRIDEVRARLAPLALLRGRAEPRRLELVRPRLTFARDAAGRFGIAGLKTGHARAPGAGLAWLLRLPLVLVRDGDLHWRDAREPQAVVTVTGIDLSLRNTGDRHRISARADFPDTLCRRCALSADLRGDPTDGAWSGEIALDTQGLDLARLPLALRERLPAHATGRVDLRLTSDWAQGQPRAARGAVAVSNLGLTATGRPLLSVSHFAGDLEWHTRARGWRLEIADLTLGLAGAPWQAGRARLEYDGAVTRRLELDRVVLDDLARFAAAHRTHHPWLARVAALEPSGMLDQVQAEITGPLAAPRAYTLRARLDDVDTRAHQRIPGVRGLSGELVVADDGGSLALAADRFVLDLPALFRAPLAAERASGMLRWQRTDSGWQVSGTDLAVQAPDASGTGQLTLELPRDPARSPVLDLRVDFRDGNGAHAQRYYPARKLPPKVLAWMESAFVAGRITRGHLVYAGPVRAFPFEHGEGRFELRAEVRDGVYRYLPGWTPLTEVHATVAIDGADARITGSGRIGALVARDVEVTVAREAAAGRRSVRVRGAVEGPVAEAVRVLRAVEADAAPEWNEALARIAQASGRGRLELQARVPLGGGKRSFLAAYSFEQAAFTLERGIALEAAAGALRLSDAGIESARLRGRAYGGPFSAALTRENGAVSVQAEGTTLLPRLLRGRGALAARVDGPVDWTLRWRDAGGRPQLHFESDLSRVRMRLPAPLDHPDGLPARRLTVTTSADAAGRMTLAVDGGPGVSGQLLLARAEDGWRFVKGRLDLGRPPGRLPAGEGLELGIAADALDIDAWLPLLRAAGARESRSVVTGVSAQIGRLVLFERDWGRTFVHLVHRGGEWRAVLDGDAVAGEAILRPGDKGAPTVRLDLAYLRLPSGGPSRDTEDAPPPDPRTLPRVDIEARSLEHKGRRYGALVMRATPYAQGWRIERLSLARPETALSLAGTWERNGERHSSRFSLELKSEDLGATLDAWGIPGQLRNGHVQLQADLVWPGPPTRPVLRGLDGRVEISAERGRFLQFDPGAARLFGLLDLSAIGRYLTLDFSPALAKGLVFDAIHTDITIAQGNASTDALIMSGPSLNLRASGRVGLGQEDYDLRLEVSPQVGDTLTLTTWGLFGPQAAAAVLAFKQLFRRQLQESTRISYTIRGSWEDPQIERVPKPAPDLPGPTP